MGCRERTSSFSFPSIIISLTEGSGIGPFPRVSLEEIPMGDVETLIERYGDQQIRAERKGYRDEHGAFIRHGTTTCWHPDGQKSRMEEYVHGKLHGRRLEWHRSGAVKSEGEYEEGRLQGKYREWKEDGGLVKEEEYRNGEKHGVCFDYYEDGAIFTEYPYVKGNLHGPGKLWLRGGMKIAEVEYVNGEEVPGSRWIDEKLRKALEKQGE